VEDARNGVSMHKFRKTVTLLMLSVFLASAGVAHACQTRCWLAAHALDGSQHHPFAAHDHTGKSTGATPPVVRDAVSSFGGSHPVCGANSACLLASVLAPAAQHQLHEPMSVERAVPFVHVSFSSFFSKPPEPRPKSQLRLGGPR
jgi:hypothetical protein